MVGAVTSALCVEELRKRYGERVAVHGLSFEVGRGEILGMLGPNGAGKSTTFQILAGMLQRDGGRILRDGKEIEPSSAAYRAQLGVVFQAPSLDIHLTAIENLEMAAALYALPRGEVKARAKNLLDLMGLGDRAKEQVRQFSGGMRRRLELARVLMHRPSLLLLDEPTTGLDVGAVRQFWNEMDGWRREYGTTLVVTTHSPEEANRCDQLVLIDKGEKLTSGTPRALCEKVLGHVVSLEIEPGHDGDELRRELQTRYGIEPREVEGRMEFERENAHELVPRIVELAPGKIRSISVHPPSLGDVFVKLTGRSL